MSSNISRGDDSSSDEREQSEENLNDKRDQVREILISPPDDNETDEELGFNERE